MNMNCIIFKFKKYLYLLRTDKIPKQILCSIWIECRMNDAFKRLIILGRLAVRSGRDCYGTRPSSGENLDHLVPMVDRKL